MEWALLAPLSEDDRRDFLRATHRRRFRKGETIFHEGDPGDALHLIDKGHAAIRVTTPRGNVATLLVNGPGSFFGELALLSDSDRRNATVVALDATETLSLHRGQFEELRERHRAVERILTAMLSTEVRRLSARLAEAHFLPAEVRIYRRLIDLEEVFGGHPPTTIPLTQDDLASLAGTTRPTVNKVLRPAQDKGALRLGRSSLEVLDVDWLERKARG
jgi:CRP/FNR family transcriptional regulator, cyclic AMP receptor protein